MIAKNDTMSDLPLKTTTPISVESSNDETSNEKEESMDQFLSTMGFAFGNNKSCECDECDISSCNVTPIVDAVQEHKRLKLLMESNPTQTRKLVCRDTCGISIWKWNLPLNSKPLIEFGNSHRIILIHKLRKDTQVQSIGGGIIGSSQEESNRTNVSWEEGRAYFLPSNGGKALGWTAKCQNDEIQQKNNINVEIFMMKSTLENMSSTATQTDSSWAIKVLQIIRKNSRSKKNGSNDEPKGGNLLSENEVHTLKKIILELNSHEEDTL